MIIATAGHVDHGKTELVRALTGVHTDRLAEEQRRGLTIEPGFAYIDHPGGQRLGFVDVPGHERFLRNMLAGVAMVDFVLLVVAADDGPMPQTREHLWIVDLLGMGHGAVVVSKCDRVTPQQVTDVATNVRALLASTTLADAPLFATSTVTGEGLDELDALLAAQAGKRPGNHEPTGRFRLAVDRDFTIAGAGRVVAGAVAAGRAQTGDELMVSPLGVPVRVRSLRLNNRPAEATAPGARCALNIVSGDLPAETGLRGQWLVAREGHLSTCQLDTQLRVLPDEPRALGHWTPVHLHIGAAVVNARVVPLNARELEPGDQGKAQLVLDRPVNAVHGTRFVIRDQSARRTMGGGRVLDPFARKRGRNKSPRLAWLAALDEADGSTALPGLLTDAVNGIPLPWLAATFNLTQAETEALAASDVGLAIHTGDDRRLVAREHWEALCMAITRELGIRHHEEPASPGLIESALIEGLRHRGDPALVRAALRALLDSGTLERQRFCISLSGHQPRLPPDEATDLERIRAILTEAGLRPPIVGELAELLDEEKEALRTRLERYAALGYLVRVADNRYFLPETVEELAGIARALAKESDDGTFDAARYRDRSGIGRNLTVQVLEFLDRLGVTRFAGGRRWPAPDSPYGGDTRPNHEARQA